MDFTGLLVQSLNGLSEASSLFLVAAGLSLIFGVTRVVNFAHGSLYMLGLYVAYSIVERIGQSAVGFWAGLVLAALVVGALGAAIEVVVMRRIYRAPELFQLLATFAVVLIVNDATLRLWGADDLLGRRAPGLGGAVMVFGRRYPSYDLALLVIGPAVLGGLWLLLTRTRWGRLVRAATEDREMLGALGVDQAWLFTGVFALGAALAGLGGAVQLPREPANLGLDLRTIGDAFVVVVVGGMGSIPGAYVAALLIAEIKALCIGLGTVRVLGLTLPFSELTLVAEFVVMAVVLVFRPWGLLGRPQATSRHGASPEPPLRPAAPAAGWAAVGLVALLASLPAWSASFPYAMVLTQDILVAVLFAASLHFIMGPGGMHSFGHAAYFGLGSFGAALLLKQAALPMPWSLALAPAVAALGALAFGWFCVRLSGVYLAMLTLAFAQIVWSVAYQWNDITGGSNGLTGVWPSSGLTAPWYYGLTLALVVASVWAIRRMAYSPFGYAMRAGRDSPRRAEAIGIDVKRVQWMAFTVSGAFAGLAGALYAFSKGSISPDVMAVGRSVDGLVMVLLGGVQTLAGPVVGAVAYTVLQDTIIRATDYWRAALGSVILLLVLVFPQGIAGAVAPLTSRWRARTPRVVPTAGDGPP